MKFIDSFHHLMYNIQKNSYRPYDDTQHLKRKALYTKSSSILFGGIPSKQRAESGNFTALAAFTFTLISHIIFI